MIRVHVFVATAVLISAVAGAPSRKVARIFGCVDLFSATESIFERVRHGTGFVVRRHAAEREQLSAGPGRAKEEEDR